MTSREFRKRAEALARGEHPKKRPATPRPKATLKPKPKPAKAYTPRTWGEALAHIVKRDHVSMAEAGKRAAREYPGLHPARRAQ